VDSHLITTSGISTFALRQIIKEIADSGVKVIIAGSSVGELTLHYLNRMSIVVVKVLSKFDLRRLCRVVNATPLARMGAPTPEEAGFVDVLECIEIGGDRVTVLRQLSDEERSGAAAEGEKSRTSTIVLRGATQNSLDDLERAVDDGVNVLKALLKDARLVPGAGATELELAKRVEAYGSGLKGLSQHAVRKFATALEVVPRTLAENALGGAEGNEVLGKLWARHNDAQEGGPTWGVDIEVRLTPIIPFLLQGRLCTFFSATYRRTLAPTERCQRHCTTSTTRSQQNRGLSGSRPRRPSQSSASTALS
jgi:T-complex protein 1 subunit theta